MASHMWHGTEWHDLSCLCLKQFDVHMHADPMQSHVNTALRTSAENVIKPGASQAADKLEDTAQQVKQDLPRKADEASDKVKQQTKQAADQAREKADNPPDFKGQAQKAADKVGQ